MTPQLLQQIHRVTSLLPATLLESIVSELATSELQPDNTIQAISLLRQFPNPDFRRIVADLIAVWQQEPMPVDNRSLAAALQTAAYCTQAAKTALSVELVWTGPDSGRIRLRRTDQVLLQLIREARQELTIISFAVYRIPQLAKALTEATNRGVALRIIAETPESGEGKIGFGIRAALNADILRRSQMLVWPLDRRPVDAEGRHGSLHAKCAIADRQHLFISSANLTEYALTLNMEMGLLVHSEELARQVAEHIDRLILEGILLPG